MSLRGKRRSKRRRSVSTFTFKTVKSTNSLNRKVLNKENYDTPKITPKIPILHELKTINNLQNSRTLPNLNKINSSRSTSRKSNLYNCKKIKSNFNDLNNNQIQSNRYELMDWKSLTNIFSDYSRRSVVHIMENDTKINNDELNQLKKLENTVMMQRQEVVDMLPSFRARKDKQMRKEQKSKFREDGLYLRRNSYAYNIAKYNRDNEKSLLSKLSNDMKGIIDPNYILHYKKDKLKFASVEQFAILKLNELDVNTPLDYKKLHYINRLKLCIVCDIVESLFDTYVKHNMNLVLYNKLKIELFKSIFVDLYENKLLQDQNHSNILNFKASKLPVNFGIDLFCKSLPYFVVTKTAASNANVKNNSVSNNNNATFNNDYDTIGKSHLLKMLRGAMLIRKRFKLLIKGDLKTYVFRNWKKETQISKKEDDEVNLAANRIRNKYRRNQLTNLVKKWKKLVTKNKIERLMTDNKLLEIQLDKAQEYSLRLIKENSKQSRSLKFKDKEYLEKHISITYNQFSPIKVKKQREFFIYLNELNIIKNTLITLTKQQTYYIKPLNLNGLQQNTLLSVNDITNEQLALKWLKYQLSEIEISDKISKYIDLDIENIEFNNFSEIFKNRDVYILLFSQTYKFISPTQLVDLFVFMKEKNNTSGNYKLSQVIHNIVQNDLDMKDVNYFDILNNNEIINYKIILKLIYSYSNIQLTNSKIQDVIDEINRLLKICNNMCNKPLNSVIDTILNLHSYKMRKSITNLNTVKNNIIHDNLLFNQLRLKINNTLLKYNSNNRLLDTCLVKPPNQKKYFDDLTNLLSEKSDVSLLISGEYVRKLYISDDNLRNLELEKELDSNQDVLNNYLDIILKVYNKPLYKNMTYENYITFINKFNLINCNKLLNSNIINCIFREISNNNDYKNKNNSVFIKLTNGEKVNNLTNTQLNILSAKLVNINEFIELLFTLANLYYYFNNSIRSPHDKFKYFLSHFLYNGHYKYNYLIKTYNDNKSLFILYKHKLLSLFTKLVNLSSKREFYESEYGPKTIDSHVLMDYFINLLDESKKETIMDILKYFSIDSDDDKVDYYTFCYMIIWYSNMNQENNKYHVMNDKIENTLKSL